jgi:hypothetical protein
MSKRKTQEKFISELVLIHLNEYDYSKVIYKSGKLKIIIICRKHGEFLQLAGNHLRGSRCPDCSNESQTDTTEEWVKEASKVHLYKYDYSKVNYVNNNTEVIINCPNHGDFLQKPAAHKSAKKGCSECAIEAKRYSNEEWIYKCSIVHNNKYDYTITEYTGNKNKVKIICNEHGVFEQKAMIHIAGHDCKKCTHNNPKSNTEEFIKQAIKVHCDTFSYSKVDYTHSKSKVIITCDKHGDFLQEANSHLNGAGCKKCRGSISKEERGWLDQLNIPEKYRQHPFLIKNKKYIVDAFDPTTNTIYEYNGDYWHGNPKFFDKNDFNTKACKTFGQLYKRTKKKERMFKKLGYNIISIWGSDFNK